MTGHTPAGNTKVFPPFFSFLLLPPSLPLNFSTIEVGNGEGEWRESIKL